MWQELDVPRSKVKLAELRKEADKEQANVEVERKSSLEARKKPCPTALTEEQVAEAERRGLMGSLMGMHKVQAVFAPESDDTAFEKGEWDERLFGMLGSQPSPIEESAPPPCPSLPPTLRPNLPPTEFVAPPPPPAVASSAPPGFSPPPVASEPLVAPPLPLAHQSPRRPGIPIPEYDSDYTSSSHSPIDHTRAAKFVGLQSEDWLAKPATAPPKQREESEEQARCRTIAQRMAKLGGIKLGMPNAPPPAPTHKSA
ncbi:hypothetical protein RSOL_293130, partial [Rhizoctonia solani AG-3 Rhs1AP]